MTTPIVPSSGGHYSAFKRAGELVYIAGQVPRDAERKLIGSTIEEQTVAALGNVRAVLQRAGCDLADLVKINVYLSDLNDFAAFNAAYAQVMGSSKPARTTIGCGLQGVKVEIDGVALHPDSAAAR